MAITLKIDSLRDEVAPLYLKYDREINPQGAYIEIDEDGEVTASSNAEIGNGIPNFVWHGRTRRIPCPYGVVGSSLADYLEGDEGKELLERIHVGHTVEWDGNNHVGSVTEDAQEAERELERALQELPQATIYTAEEWIEHDVLSNVWPVGKTLAEAAELSSTPKEAHQVIDGDMEEAIMDKAEGKFDYPSDAAKASRWDIARAMIDRKGWPHYQGDADDLADAVESLWPETMSCLDGFDHVARRETVAEGRQEAEAEATLAAGLDEIQMDISWLPPEVRKVLIDRRVEALNEWVEANPDPDDYRLYDSDRAEPVSAEDLGIDDDEYSALVRESLSLGKNSAGHVSTSSGRIVYAQN